MEDITEVRHAMHRRGFAIIPVTGKNPAIEGWQKIQANPELIDLWPKSYPFHRNTGVLTKFTPAIDIDILDEEAADTVEQLLRSHFEGRGMLSARIGLSPKRAFLFRTDKPFGVLKLLLVAPNGKRHKIEILCDGQQLVCHGVHPDTHGEYSWGAGTPWEDISVKDLPYLREEAARAFLHDVLELLKAEHGYELYKEPKPKGNGGDGAPFGASNWGKLFTDVYTGADFHDALRDLAMSFARVGMSQAAVVARLRSLMEASQAPRDRRWQDRYDDIPRATDTAFGKLEIEHEAAQQQRESEQQGRAEGPDEPNPEPAPKQLHDKPGPPKNVLQFFRHGERAPLDDRAYTVQDLIPVEGCGLISGQWGSYKTFNTIELSHCVMTGRSYLNQFKIRRPGGVLFFALEGASEIAARLEGVLKHKGSKVLDPAPFYWITNCPPLRHSKTANIIIETGKVVATEFQERFGLLLSLIIIDTVVTGAGYERDGQDNDAAIANMIMGTMAKVGRALGCFVFGVDHFGKDTAVGTRGSSVKEGNADVILSCHADRNESGAVSNLRLAIRKRRSGENGVEFPYHSRVVPIGTNAFGKEETTLVLHFGEDPNAPQKTRADQDWGSTKAVLHLKKVIMTLMAEHGEDIHPFAGGKPIRALKVELVEAEFFRSYPVSNKGQTERQIQNTRYQAFKRALEDAVIKKNVLVTRTIHDVEWVWLSRHSDDLNSDPGPAQDA
jgi:hypothetical protein